MSKHRVALQYLKTAFGRIEITSGDRLIDLVSFWLREQQHDRKRTSGIGLTVGTIQSRPGDNEAAKRLEQLAANTQPPLVGPASEIVFLISRAVTCC